MSHHFDTPTDREDPRLNLNDFYLFAGAPGSTVMAMTVNPQAGPSSAPFREEGIYAFRFDTDNDAREEVTFKARFGAVAYSSDGVKHTQTIEIRRATGAEADHGVGGDLVVAGVTSHVTSAARGVKVFAGVTPDLFAGDAAALESFKASLAKGDYQPEAFENRVNFFQPRRVAAIVLEVPNDLIGEGVVHAWATVSLYGRAPETQVTRWGLPLITHLYMPEDDMREDFNRSTPSGTNGRFTARIAEVIRETTSLAGTAADPAAYAQRVVDRLGTITLPYEIGSTASFDYAGFNGRGLHDDVMDVMLSLTTNSALGDGVAPDPARIRADFPYFSVDDDRH